MTQRDNYFDLKEGDLFRDTSDGNGKCNCTVAKIIGDDTFLFTFIIIWSHVLDLTCRHYGSTSSQPTYWRYLQTHPSAKLTGTGVALVPGVERSSSERSCNVQSHFQSSEIARGLRAADKCRGHSWRGVPKNDVIKKEILFSQGVQISEFEK